MTELLDQASSARTVRAGFASGTVIRCGATDTLLSGMAASLVFLFERAVDDDRLALGLSAALAHVPLFGGSLRTGADGMPEIVCDDSGVRFTVTDSPETLAGAAGRMTLPTAGFVDVAPAGPGRPDDAPLTTVKITRLADGGMVVGLSWHHALGDLQSTMLLIHAWSASVDGRELPEVRMATEREAELDAVLPPEQVGKPGYRRPTAAEMAELDRELRASPRANRIVQIWFAAGEVMRMRAAYGQQAGVRLSTNDVVLGHLIATLRRLDSDLADRRLALPVNFRRHLGLPPYTIGNLVSEVEVVTPGGAPAAELAARVRSAVDGYLSHLNVRANRAFLASVGPERVFETMPVGFEPAERTFFLTNWCRTGVYDVTFDGQRPAWFGPEIPLPTVWSSWLTEGFGGTDYLATVVVPARLASKLRGDPTLHCFRDSADALPPLAAELRKLA